MYRYIDMTIDGFIFIKTGDSAGNDEHIEIMGRQLSIF